VADEDATGKSTKSAGLRCTSVGRASYRAGPPRRQGHQI